MHLTALVRRRLVAGFLTLVGLSGGWAQAQQPDSPLPPVDVKVDARTGALIIPLGGVVQFKPPVPKPIRDIVNRNDAVLDARVDPRNPAQLILAGRRPGSSRLALVQGSKDEEIQSTYEVIVQPDYDLLRNVLKRTVPTANVEVIPGVGSAVILSGYVVRPEDADTILRIASDATGGQVNSIVNALQVGGVSHVQLDLTIAQVDRTKLRERGFTFGVGGANFGISSVLNALGTGNGALAPFAGALSPAMTPTTTPNIQFGIVPANITAALKALRSEGLAKFLSEPKLVTQTGRPAFFRSGGQQATLGPASGINGPGVILQPVGTEVEVLPIVYANNKIYLEVNPRVTSVNNGRGISTAFGFTPGFNELQTRVSVMMESGQTFAVGGLIETQVQATGQKIPYIGELPIISWPFSSNSYQEVETELLILLTPRFAAPMDCAQVPGRVPGKETRNPDDYELFLEQILEAPRGQRQVWNGKCYNAAFKCAPNADKFPCVNGVCTGPNGGCANGSCSSGVMTVGPAATDVLIGDPALSTTPRTLPPATQNPATLPGTFPAQPAVTLTPVSTTVSPNITAPGVPAITP
ncbi:MAG: hypothetical protein LC104_05155 [Bacteroidales bacterium]|nr:hypothetical protein [Bacteroidales bacterium]